MSIFAECPKVAGESSVTRGDIQGSVGVMVSHQSPEAEHSPSAVPIFWRQDHCGRYWNATGAFQPTGRPSSSMDHCFQDHEVSAVQ